MKYLALLSGFGVTLIAFVSGVGVALFYLEADSASVRPLNTAASAPINDESVRIVVPSRLSSVGRAQSDQAALDWSAQARISSNVRKFKGASEKAVDPMTTASTSPESSPQEGSKLSDAHVDWCSERYRSYDPSDNKYNAYSGARRECISPYSEDGSATDMMADNPSGSGSGSSEASIAQLDPEHVQSCFERYRSYRLEDNTFQPYGGGPRQQCEPEAR